MTGWAASSVLWVPGTGRRAFSLVASGAGWCRVRPAVERIFPTTLGPLVLLVPAARAEPSPSSQYTRAASSTSSSICLRPRPLVPYLPPKSSSYACSKRVSSYSGSTRTPRPGGPGRAISILSVYPGRILLDLFDAVSFGPLHIVVQNSLTPSQVFFVYTV